MTDSLMVTDTGLEVDALSSALVGPFTFIVPPRACLSITGPSGSGKSLLLRLIADLDPGTGCVSLNGAARSSMQAPQWRRACPYVAATPGFWAASAADHFPEETRPAAREMADAMAFDPARFDAPVERLSTGERQRIALIRALSMDPPALLLDEPTGPLDQTTTSAVADILAERIAQGLSLILVTHDDALAERLGSQRRTMRDRKLVEV